MPTSNDSINTGLVIEATGEVVQAMSVEEASSITTQIATKLDAIADGVESVKPLIREAITRRAHVALGYRSPGDYVRDRFSRALTRLEPDTRRGFAGELASLGLSTRAIAPVFDVSARTAARDVAAAGVPRGTPAVHLDETSAVQPWSERVVDLVERAKRKELAPAPMMSPTVGIDGKTYRSRRSSKERRTKSLPDSARTASAELVKAIQRVERIVDHPRYAQNEERISFALYGDLERVRDSVIAILEQMPAPASFQEAE